MVLWNRDGLWVTCDLIPEFLYELDSFYFGGGFEIRGDFELIAAHRLSV